MSIVGIICSYLLGSIPTAYIFVKVFKNMDIRQHGSGNVGATNVFRVMGKAGGFTVLALDILKGVLAVAVIPDIVGLPTVAQRIFCAVSVVVGHNWTIFLNFKGGKGIATGLGVLIGLTIKILSIRVVLIGTLGVWIISFLTSRIVSLSSIIAAISLPILMVLTNQDLKLVILGVVFTCFVVIRHRPNIKRLLEGAEPKVPIFKNNNT